jgi:hypothetical protein
LFPEFQGAFLTSEPQEFRVDSVPVSDGDGGVWYFELAELLSKCGDFDVKTCFFNVRYFLVRAPVFLPVALSPHN